MLFNEHREEEGIPGLYRWSLLTCNAKRHEQTLAEIGRLAQPNLEPMRKVWGSRQVASNVGYTDVQGDAKRVAEEQVYIWMINPFKRRLVLNATFSRTGCGIYVTGSRHWSTCLYASA